MIPSPEDQVEFYRIEFNRRIRLRNALIRDPSILPKIKLHYKYNCIDFINDWCITFDPRSKPPIPRLLPFRLFQRQYEFVHFIIGCLNDKEHGLVEKCRDMGATWLCVAISVWLWLFWPGSVIGWGSRKEEYVDKQGDPKAIFPKIRQLLQYIPSWLKPEGFKEREHAVYMRVTNPVNGSVITGEAGDNIGRGGRTTIYFKDESGHYERPELIEAALGDNTDVQIDISSVNGTANVFYRKRMAGEIWQQDAACTPGKTRVFIWDWRDSPFKDQAWHDRREQQAIENGLLHVFQQEVERNYQSAVPRIIIPQNWIEAAVDAHKKIHFPPGDKIAGQDVADDGGDKNALAIRHGMVLRHAHDEGGDAGSAAQSAIPLCVEYGVRELYYDCIGVGAGFKNEINHMQDRVDENGKSTFPRNLMVLPWNAGARVLDPTDNVIPGDMHSPTNEEMYMNLKAQAWFRMRARFKKTFDAVKNNKTYPADEMISLDSSIDRLHKLKNELSQPQYKKGDNGKTKVDKKPDGATSPNLADAVIMCYNPVREVSIFDVL